MEPTCLYRIIYMHQSLAVEYNQTALGKANALKKWRNDQSIGFRGGKARRQPKSMSVQTGKKKVCSPMLKCANLMTMRLIIIQDHVSLTMSRFLCLWAAYHKSIPWEQSYSCSEKGGYIYRKGGLALRNSSSVCPDIIDLRAQLHEIEVLWKARQIICRKRERYPTLELGLTSRI